MVPSGSPREAEAVTPTIEPFTWARDLVPADLEAATECVNAAWAEWVPGEPPMSPDAYADLDRFCSPLEVIRRHLARDEDGQVAAVGQVHWREGPGAGELQVFVHPANRGRGVGRALGEALVDVAKAEGRAGLTIQAPVSGGLGAACELAGLKPDLVVELNSAAVSAAPRDLLKRWQATGEAAPGYSLVAYDDVCPDDDLAVAFVAARHVMNDAPRFEGEPEYTFTLAEQEGVEAAAVESHTSWWVVGVRHDASGEIVGLSEMYLPQRRSWMALQGDTGVVPAHRGRGLGAWMKAVNHLRLRSERPDAEVVRTYNAASNEPMLRINRALGFAPVQRFQGWYLPLD